MIFVTVGYDFRGFDRLIKTMDEISSVLPYEVLIQRGYSSYRPKNANYFDFVLRKTFLEYIRNAKVVVSHAGIGTIHHCREEGVPLLILPRRKKYGEHMNDHQLEIARVLAEREGESVYVLDEESQLLEKILMALKEGRKYGSGESPGKLNLIRTLREFIQRI